MPHFVWFLCEIHETALRFMKEQYFDMLLYIFIVQKPPFYLQWFSLYEQDLVKVRVHDKLEWG